jgi:hypothetical protein
MDLAPKPFQRWDAESHVEEETLKITERSGKPPELSAHSGHAKAKAQLEQLESGLAEVVRRLELLELRSCRLSEEARKHLNRPFRFMPSDASDAELDKVISGIIAAGEIPGYFLARVRSGYPELPSIYPDDMEAITEIAEARASVEMFKRAISVHALETSHQRKHAIAAACERVRPERKKIAAKVAGMLFQLAEALREEYQLADRLRLQDDNIPSRLSPPPFPIPFPFDSAIVLWIAQATEMTEADVVSRLNGESASPALVNR